MTKVMVRKMKRLMKMMKKSMRKMKRMSQEGRKLHTDTQLQHLNFSDNLYNNNLNSVLNQLLQHQPKVHFNLEVSEEHLKDYSGHNNKDHSGNKDHSDNNLQLNGIQEHSIITLNQLLSS